MKKLLLLFVMTLAAPSAYAGGTCGCGHYNPSGVEADCISHMCPGGSHGDDYAYMCGSGSGGGGIDWENFAWGKQGYYALKSIPERCGGNPLCASIGVMVA